MSQEPAQPSLPGVECQLESFPVRLPTGAPSREEPWGWYLRRRWQGLRLRLGRELGRFTRRSPEVPAPRPQVSFPPADVREGDLVRVRSVEEILATLDESGCLHGCGFGLGQYQFCGRQVRVARRVEHFFDEARARMLRGRNLVLLEGVHCDGSSVRWTEGCQRMCFYFWRTEWLEKVGEP